MENKEFMSRVKTKLYNHGEQKFMSHAKTKLYNHGEQRVLCLMQRIGYVIMENKESYVSCKELVM